ncbi:MAG: copper amine oxidase N-terminal domain-containing protein [Defluviitaleaceae bacterium]|nr:copper amine oxidase N-terminal domain-containing protein [Defluviitaleaceae bacterium]
MNLQKRILTLILAVVMLAASGFGLAQATFANDRITVIVDGQFVHFPDAEPQIINERVMVPVRALGEAIGAEVNWDPDTSTVLLTLGTRYATLTVGAEVMLFGEFVRSAAGVMEATSADVFPLDSPPVIVDGDRAVFPVRAIAYAFDVPSENVEWRADVRAVVITTAPPTPTPTPAPTPAPTPPPAQQVFPNTQFYNERSGGWIQDLHNASAKFAVVVFDGRDTGSHTAVRRVIDAANEAEFTGLVGFDVSGSFPNPDRLTWVWEEMNTNQLPFVAFSFSGREDYFVTDLSNANELYEMFENIARTNPRLPSARPTPTPSPSPSPSPSPGTSGGTSNIRQDQFSWNRVELSATQGMYDRNESFAIFIYNTNDHDINRVRDRVRELAQDESIPMYHASFTTGITWLERYVGRSDITDSTVETPMVLVVRGRDNVQFFLGVGTGDQWALRDALWSFNRHLRDRQN